MRPVLHYLLLMVAAAILGPGGFAVAGPTDVLSPELATSLEPVVDLEEGWRNPPTMARTRCWWWWLNGNVTKDAITRDLEEMKAQGLGGATIIDAGGAEQRGHRQVPHGPDFVSAPWRELFLHALSEAARLDLELGWNIQSGWNLGGPTVTPEYASKKLAWTETNVRGGVSLDLVLDRPDTVGGFYRDIAVLAIPLSGPDAAVNPLRITTQRSRADHPPQLAIDGDRTTYWQPGDEQGPRLDHPVRLEFNFALPTTVSQIVIYPHNELGPKRGWVQAADDPRRWRLVARWNAESTGRTVIDLPATQAQRFRLVIVDAHDPQSPLRPRGVKIAEVELRDNGDVLGNAVAELARIANYEQKAYFQYPGPFTATKADHLLEVGPGDDRQRVIQSSDVVDLTERVDQEGRLRWAAPAGVWRILRVGYTLSGARVSTHSEGWDGWAIDYLDPAAFDRYWQEVLVPLLDAAEPYLGRSLKYLSTDSWELGPVNWTPKFPEQFRELRGYEMQPFLPALAGYVVDDRQSSNRFLNDFRRTLADLIARGKYGTFREYAHARGLAVHPESGGPHAAPIDALLCLGRNDIPMGEFWARSQTHRVHDHERLFIKQPASAAHVYGKRLIYAEAFTSIGPQWEKSPRDLKPVFDRVACEGLNLVALHTFDCSPAEMGIPGQAYFAGTHINPNVTWWHRADAFFQYMNRAQFLLQQGLPVADVLYFYGENVPSFVRLKDDDPAGVLPGYDYDVINAEALLSRTSVHDGRIVLPDGTSYRLLVLPGPNHYNLPVLEHVAKLVRDGATIVGPRPTAPLGLRDDDRFRSLAARLWSDGDAAEPGRIADVPARSTLEELGVAPDMTATDDGDEPPHIDYFHRRTDSADIYFLVNRLPRWQDAECSLRVSGRQPELWDPLTGDTTDADAFWQEGRRTIIPLRFAPEGSLFVVFRRPISNTARGPRNQNGPRRRSVLTIDGPWQVTFDPDSGGPEQQVPFAQLRNWSEHESDAIKYYSGTATYRTTFQHTEEVNGRAWLDLGRVRELAHVRLNGEDLGVAWTEPFRIEVTNALRQGENDLEIEVTNLWPNRLIGDQRLPPSERRTRTNIRKFRDDSPLLESGLLGPVRLMAAPR